jgi:hypothetical protein
MLQKKAEILQAGTGLMDVFPLNPCIQCYPSKCVPSELCEFIFQVQTQLQKNVCCERQAFGGSILVWELPAGKIGLKDANEVNVTCK